MSELAARNLVCYVQEQCFQEISTGGAIDYEVIHEDEQEDDGATTMTTMVGSSHIVHDVPEERGGEIEGGTGDSGVLAGTGKEDDRFSGW
ncbi:unnamed protein product [Gongylonema pulchrum]|uniref:Uncharacterized protein n=1 Tax=Gongylonema pulchrum TaxID=637853 RepID=A0A183E6S3_9BILA|nr:unnamed protein product [Gongylonema pulchrum]